MKHTIQSLTLLLIFGLLIVTDGAAQRNSNIGRYTIETECLGVEMDGSVTLRAWGTGRNRFDAVDQAKKNAVHGVIFKGFGGISGVPGQHPLTDNPNLEIEQAEFFRNFFANGGKYMKFVNVTNDGSVAAEDRLKVGKEYKIGVVVSVNVAGLRKDL